MPTVMHQKHQPACLCLKHPFPTLAPMGTAAARLVWVDALRGFVSVLVVLHHVIADTMIAGAVVDDSAAQWTSLAIMNGLRPLRMPLFFFVAGALAAHTLDRPWAALMRGKSGLFLWVTAVWSVVIAITIILLPSVTDALGGDYAGVGAGGAFVLGVWAMWFLLALALYFPLAKFVAGLPPRVQWAVLGASGILYLLFVELPVRGQLGPIVAYAVFFLLGALVPRLLFDARRHARWRLAGGLALFVGAQAVDAALGTRSTVGLLIASCGAILWVPTLFAMVVHGASTRRWTWLATLGQRTMQLYATQNVVVFAMIALAIAAGFTISTFAGALAWMVLATAATVALCSTFSVVAERWTPWLFALPTRRRRAAPRPTGAKGRRSGSAFRGEASA